MSAKLNRREFVKRGAGYAAALAGAALAPTARAESRPAASDRVRRKGTPTDADLQTIRGCGRRATSESSQEKRV
jgi:anaerobic selenocysteine-containing dehydrogenase